ncbi:aspartate/glutamate racemase family protein [Roseovarius autotrophicus]|uniref:aspartate/glutamate racemase family protein n=1 Tax=Roseovarius autotrophicus TaxID=2824121 RepID=UPI0019E359F4|nr:amino acid racemase [Roseovarius autotrophicus]MBE0453313.1 amino acid racemase [Roseovarius sp.]
MKTVGILGGMGPEATILLMQKVLAAVPARDDADHVPLLVHQNPQVPSRIKALIEGGGTDPGPVLARMARDLRAAGAKALAMPCNTAHHYAPAIQNATDLPFLDMLELTAEHLSMVGARRVGMLASPATRLAGVFDAPFAAHGLTPVFLDDDTSLLAIIRAVKASEGPIILKPRLRSEAETLLSQGADHLLVACTELSLMTDALPQSAARTDSLDCLTRAIVAFARA